MSTVPERLRQAREARQMTVEQVADITKMRTDHVRALEAGDWSFFAAPVYIRGFVRSYATLLKLEVPLVMRDLDEEIGERSSPGITAGNTSQGSVNTLTLQLSNINWRRGMLLLAVVGIVSLLGVAWFSFQSYRRVDPLKGLAPGIYEPTKRSGETLPVPAPRR